MRIRPSCEEEYDDHIATCAGCAGVARVAEADLVDDVHLLVIGLGVALLLALS